MTRKFLFLFSLPFILITTLAYGQVFLGNVFRLGQSTDAAKPAAATVNKGGLLYITDGDAGTGVSGAIAYSNGSSWLPLSSGSSSSGSFNWDASFAWNGGPGSDGPADLGGGAHFGAASTGSYSGSVTGTTVFYSPAIYGTVLHNNANLFNGLTLSLVNDDNSGIASLGFYKDSFATGTYYGRIVGGSLPGNNYPEGLTIGVNDPGGTASFTIRNESSGAIAETVDVSSFEYTNNAASGNDAIQLTTGARIHAGSGSLDYHISDGTGLETPGYWESTRAFGDVGVITPMLQVSGAANDSFTSANADSAGVVTFDTTFGRTMYQPTSTTFAPFAQDHTYERWSISTRILDFTNAFPEISERVRSNATDTIQMYWTSTGCTGATTTTSGNRSYYSVTTSAETNRQCYGTVATSDATTTLKPIFDIDLQPEMCMWLRTGATITNSRWWVGLTTTVPSSATSTMAGNGTMFRYDTSVDGLLYLCNRDGSTQSCSSTGITVATSTDYHLCIYVDSSRASWGWVNGIFRVKNSTNSPAANSRVAPFMSYETLTASSNAVAFGVMRAGSF